MGRPVFAFEPFYESYMPALYITIFYIVSHDILNVIVLLYDTLLQILCKICPHLHSGILRGDFGHITVNHDVD